MAGPRRARPERPVSGSSRSSAPRVGLLADGGAVGRRRRHRGSARSSGRGPSPVDPSRRRSSGSGKSMPSSRMHCAIFSAGLLHARGSSSVGGSPTIGGSPQLPARRFEGLPVGRCRRPPSAPPPRRHRSPRPPSCMPMPISRPCARRPAGASGSSTSYAASARTGRPVERGAPVGLLLGQRGRGGVAAASSSPPRRPAPPPRAAPPPPHAASAWCAVARGVARRGPGSHGPASMPIARLGDP